jgi:hypothetical protein
MTEVAICNQALGWLGGNSISSLGDSSNEAQLCNANYANLRDAVLEDAAWSFAIKRARIAKLSAAPEYGFASQFVLPKDTIRVLNVQDGGYDTDPDVPGWQREGNTIVCDRDAIYIKYIARISDTTMFTSGFKQALAARIAADLSIPLTQSRQMQSDMWSLYRAKLGDASTTDSLQGRSRRIRSRWVDQSRVGGGSNSMGPTV